jgi:hypothetical protein
MATYPLPGACDPVPPVEALSADQSVLPPAYQAVFGDCNAARPAIVASPRPRAPRFIPDDEDPAEIGQAKPQPSVPTRFRGRLLDDEDEEFCYPASAAFPTPVASSTAVVAAGNDLASADRKGATLLEPRPNIVPENGDPGDSDVTKPASIPGIVGLLAPHAVTDKEPAISSEPIALIKAITAKSVATEGELATYVIRQAVAYYIYGFHPKRITRALAEHDRRCIPFFRIVGDTIRDGMGAMLRRLLHRRDRGREQGRRGATCRALHHECASVRAPTV